MGDEIYLTIQSLSISNPPLEETLSFNDVLTVVLIQNTQETLYLTDIVDSDKDAVVALTETLTLVDVIDVTSNISVTLTESLDLVDTINRNIPSH